MVDIKGAAMAGGVLIGSGTKASTKLPMNAAQESSLVQNTGIYDLVFPVMHVDYPTRDEVYMAIQGAFLKHHSSNMHGGSSPGATVISPVETIPRETAIDGQSVRAGSPVNAIGYGI